jgi:hypothetical protein
MIERILKFKNSGLFMVMVMLLCSFFGVTDASAMTADVINPAAGGAIHTDAMTTHTDVRVDSPNLLEDTVEEKVTVIRPYEVSLVTVASQISDIRKSNNQTVRHYIIDVIDSTATLSTAVAGGVSQTALSTSNDSIFASEQTILVNGVQGYKEDGTTIDPDNFLTLYVVGKDAGNQPLVTAVNGTGATGDIIPAIPANATLIRMGRAGAETQMQTDAYSGVPTDYTQYLQKFMAQVEMSEIYKRADKEVNWDFTDLEKEAIFDMKATQNVSFWKGPRKRLRKKNAHTQKAEDIYLTGGIWAQAGKDFSFGGLPVDAKNIVTLMKHAFADSSSGHKKLLIMGGDVVEAFEQIDYNKIVYPGTKMQAYGLEFGSIVSKFGTLLTLYDKSFDRMEMKDKFFILDADFLVKWTMGWRVNDFDFRKSGQADADGRGLIEICGLSLKNPKAHSRGSL